MLLLALLRSLGSPCSPTPDCLECEQLTGRCTQCPAGMVSLRRSDGTRLWTGLVDGMRMLMESGHPGLTLSIPLFCLHHLQGAMPDGGCQPCRDDNWCGAWLARPGTACPACLFACAAAVLTARPAHWLTTQPGHAFPLLARQLPAQCQL